MGQCSSGYQPYEPEQRNLKAIKTKNLIGNMLSDECELKLKSDEIHKHENSDYDSYSLAIDDTYSNITKSSARKLRDSTLTITGYDGSTLGKEDTRHDMLAEDNIHIAEHKNRSLNELIQHDEQTTSSSDIGNSQHKRKSRRSTIHDRTQDSSEQQDVVHDLGTIHKHMMKPYAPKLPTKKVSQSQSSKHVSYVSKKSSRMASDMSSQLTNLSISSSIHISLGQNTQRSNIEEPQYDDIATSSFGSDFQDLQDGPSNTSGIAQTDVHPGPIDIRGNMNETDSFNSPRSVQQNSMIFRPQASGGLVQGNSNDQRNNTEDTLQSTSSSRVEALQSFPSIQKISNPMSTNTSKDKTQLLRRTKNPMPEFMLFSRPFIARIEWLENRPRTDISIDTDDEETISLKQQQLYVL